MKFSKARIVAAVAGAGLAVAVLAGCGTVEDPVLKEMTIKLKDGGTATCIVLEWPAQHGESVDPEAMDCELVRDKDEKK